MSTYTFKADRYKGLVDEVEITSGQGLVILAGDNKAGKSSFLDAIREVLRFAGSRETPEPIHQGADEAVVEITDHERGRIYRRTFRRSKDGKITSTVTVLATDGAKYSNPAEILAEDVGAEIIDAGEFARMSAKDQREVLLRQISLPFDLDEMARQKAGAEDRRRELGREVTRLTGVLSEIPKPASDTPTVEVSAQAIFDEIQAAQGIARRHEQERAKLDDLAAETDRVTAQIAELTARLTTLGEATEAQTATVAALPEVPDIEPLQARLADVDATNAAVRSRVAWEKARQDLADAETAHAAAQTQLDKIDATKREGLAQAAFPDPLLSFDDTGVLYDGIPFQQLNDADKRVVGARILVGASDRKLRLGFLREGDLLDDETLGRLEQVAADADYVFLVERGRDSSKEIGWRLHEGALVKAAV